jgi:MSHA biogenesis protein MshK
VVKLFYQLGLSLLFICFTSVTASANTEDDSSASDPTAPLSWTAPKQVKTEKKKTYYPVPKLKSIVCLGGVECSVILNDRLVEQGDWVSGYQVQKIDNEYVVLVRQGKRWVLELFDSTIKQ